MSSYHIPSGNMLRVFPTSLRVVNSNGKFTSEENISNIIRSVTDRDSFIIKAPDDSDNTWEIVVHGFYFKFELGRELGKNLYARIVIDSTGRLVSTDSGGEMLDSTSDFLGIDFGNSNAVGAPAGCVEYTLQLTGEDGKVLQASFCKLNASSLLVQKGGESKSVETAIDELTTGVEGKQDKINSNNPLDISGGNVTGQLGENHGGTGKSTLADVTVGKAKLLVNDSDQGENIGSDSIPVYFLNGKPQEASPSSFSVDSAKKLVEEKVDEQGLTVLEDLVAGSTSCPVYFKDGKPVEVDFIDSSLIPAVGAAYSAQILVDSENSGLNEGTSSKPVYFSDGKPVQVTSIDSSLLPANYVAGSAKKLVDGSSDFAVGSYDRPVYFTGGIPSACRAVFVQSSPPGGSDGDIWINI